MVCIWACFLVFLKPRLNIPGQSQQLVSCVLPIKDFSVVWWSSSKQLLENPPSETKTEQLQSFCVIVKPKMQPYRDQWYFSWAYTISFITVVTNDMWGWFWPWGWRFRPPEGPERCRESRKSSDTNRKSIFQINSKNSNIILLPFAWTNQFVCFQHLSVSNCVCEFLLGVSTTVESLWSRLLNI